MTSENKIIRIAHISDLHFVANQIWIDRFEDLKKSLVKQAPDIILITGDLLDSPSQYGYDSLSSYLKSVAEEIKKVKEIFIVSVPGNHDHLQKGWQPRKSYCYRKNESSLQYPTDAGMASVIKNIYQKHNLAIFPFNSNGVGITDWFNFAAGKIINPLQTFLDYKELFQDIHNCHFRFAMLHHHPLPMKVPNEYKEQLTQQFHVLKNAHEFLKLSIQNELDVILHGHMHVVGGSEYKSVIEYGNHKKLRVIGCGTSCKYNSEIREYLIHDVHPDGYINSYVHEVVGKGREFAERTSIPLVPYESYRKSKSLNESKYAPNATIRCVKQKTKFVKISEKGDAAVDIFYDDIELVEEAQIGDTICVEEIATADVGRIPFYRSYIGVDIPRVDKTSFFESLSKSKFELLYNKMPEQVSMDHALQCKNNKSKYHAYFIYKMLSGFCTSAEEYDFIYSPTIFKTKTEFSCCSTDYRTETLEIIINFEDSKAFPEPSSFLLLAIKKASIDYDKDGFSFAKQEYEVCNTETEFINSKGAVTIRPSRTEVFARIRYPQPDMIYIMRWDLPPFINKNRSLRLRTQKLREKISTSPNYSSFTSQAIKKLEPILTNSRFDFVLLTITKDISTGVTLFKCVSDNPKLHDKEFFITRGIAGRAFKYGIPKLYDSNDQNQEQYIEKMYEGYDPSMAVSIPIILLDRQTVSTVIADDKNYDPSSQVVCLVSIVFEKSFKLSNETQAETATAILNSFTDVLGYYLN